MKTKEERANDKISKIVEIYLAIEISYSSKKMPKKEERSPKIMKHIVDVGKFNIAIDRKKQLQKECHGCENSSQIWKTTKVAKHQQEKNNIKKNSMQFKEMKH